MDNKIDEKWYQIDGTENKRIRKIAVAILIVVAVLWGYSAWKSARHVPALPGEVILKATMAFEEADSKVQEAGNIPKAEAYTKGVDMYRNYEGGEAFVVSVAASDELEVLYLVVVVKHYGDVPGTDSRWCEFDFPHACDFIRFGSGFLW